MNFRQQYDSARDEIEQAATNITCLDASMTQQHHTEDADLNVIAKRYGLTDGAIPPQAMDPRFFGDFTSVVHLQDALNQTRQATDAFNALPAHIRKRFNNSPIDLWEFVNDDANLDEAMKLGLLHPEYKKPEPPVTVTPAQDPK